MNIVFDIGGTKMRVAAAEGEAVGEMRKIPTPEDPHEGVDAFVKLAHEVVGTTFERAAGSIAADHIDENGVLHRASNLKLWEGTPFLHLLSDALGVPVQAANDAVVVGIGELHKGAGRGFKRIAYITVSTGVGGALVGAGDDTAAAPILGELKLNVGPLEPQISGTAVKQKFGIEPKDLESLEERTKLADILAAALAEIHDAWNPDAFVIGGSMIVGMNPIPLDHVRAQFASVPVLMAELGDNGGLVGGAILAARPIPSAGR